MLNLLINTICIYGMLGCLLYLYATYRVDKKISYHEQNLFLILGRVFYPIITLIGLTEEIKLEIKFKKDLKSIQNNPELTDEEKHSIISFLKSIRYSDDE